MTVPGRSKKEFSIESVTDANTVIANAMSSGKEIRAQAKTYGDGVPVLVVFNDADTAWTGSISWMAR